MTDIGVADWITERGQVDTKGEQTNLRRNCFDGCKVEQCLRCSMLFPVVLSFCRDAVLILSLV